MLFNQENKQVNIKVFTYIYNQTIVLIFFVITIFQPPDEGGEQQHLKHYDKNKKTVDNSLIVNNNPTLEMKIFLFKLVYVYCVHTCTHIHILKFHIEYIL